jgi:hypothetical protein
LMLLFNLMTNGFTVSFPSIYMLLSSQVGLALYSLSFLT